VVLTIIIVLVMLVIGVGLTALYREVGLGRGEESESPSSPPSKSQWPLGGLTAGSRFAVPSDDTFTGFLAICTDDDDALGAMYSVAVVAEEWDYPMLIAIGKTFQANGWTDRLDGLPGNIGQYDLRIDQVQALQPATLPVVLFLNEGRLLDASPAMDSASLIATSFQHCRFGLTR